LAADGRDMAQQLFRHHHEARAMTLRAGHDDRAGRRAERSVGAVQLEAGGAAARQTEVADEHVVNPFDDPGRPRVVGAGLSTVIRAFEESLRREADRDDLLRRASVSPPETAVGAIERVIVLTDLGVPRADAALGAPDLDDAGHRRAGGDAPVKS